jgi:uncharacterized protein
MTEIAPGSPAPPPAAVLPTGHPRRSIAPAWHTCTLILGVLVWALLGYHQAKMMRSEALPPRLELYLGTMTLEWLLFAYVWVGIRLRGVTLRQLTGPKWRGARDLFTNLGIAVLFWIIAAIILAAVGFVVGLTRKPGIGQPSVQFMVPHNATELVIWLLLAATAAVCEETIFRGYFQYQMILWTRSTSLGVIAAAILFGAGHIYQGIRNSVVITVFGALFGILAAWRRDVKPGMLVHGWQDTLAGVAGFLQSKGYVHIPW